MKQFQTRSFRGNNERKRRLAGAEVKDGCQSDAARRLLRGSSRHVWRNDFNMPTRSRNTDPLLGSGIESSSSVSLFMGVHGGGGDPPPINQSFLPFL